MHFTQRGKHTHEASRHPPLPAAKPTTNPALNGHLRDLVNEQRTLNAGAEGEARREESTLNLPGSV